MGTFSTWEKGEKEHNNDTNSVITGKATQVGKYWSGRCSPRLGVIHTVVGKVRRGLITVLVLTSSSFVGLAMNLKREKRAFLVNSEAKFLVISDYILSMQIKFQGA